MIGSTRFGKYRRQQRLFILIASDDEMFLRAKRLHLFQNLADRHRLISIKSPSIIPIHAASYGYFIIYLIEMALGDIQRELKGVYGRMHVQAFKLASLFGALDWLKTSDAVPTITGEHWQAGQALAESWRHSVHRLLEQLDRSGEAVQEKRHQDRLLNAIRQAGATGIALRDLYRNLNFSAKQARHLAQDLVRAGLIEERRMDRAEWFIAIEYISEQD